MCTVKWFAVKAKILRQFNGERRFVSASSAKVFAYSHKKSDWRWNTGLNKR